MAEHVLETRILLRYGTYAQWMSSDVILKLGEAAVAAFPNDRIIDNLSNSRPDNTPPAIGIKIGDGIHRFNALPWVQAVAADVYNWAKSSAKPTYTASEIQNLQNYIENVIYGDTNVTIAPRIYSLVQGTGDNVDKYYLLYKENNEEGPWIVDTSAAIDLSDLTKIINWIGQTNLNEYDDLITRNAELIRYFINKLEKIDNEVTHLFITSVSLQNGIILVTRAQPSFIDISGTATVEQGGTGRSTLTENNILVGDGTNQVRLVPIAEELTNTDAIPTSRLVKSYVDQATSGLSGAMHFIGEATIEIYPNTGTNPQINNYNFSNALPGDVILYNNQEFVWDGGAWRLLGDESSYAVKGSIKNSDIADNAEIDLSKIAGLNDTFDTKVDKVSGKVLSSNDFTDELKQKLEDIGTNAETNVIEHIMLNGNEILPTTINNINKVVNLQILEFDTESLQKLFYIERNAQVNKIEKIVFDGLEITPENKTVTLNSDPHKEHANVIESISINGTEYPPNKDKLVNITIDQAALNLNVLEGAQVPNGASTLEVEQVNKKLLLARIAVTGNVQDLQQTNDTYIIFNCGSSTEVI